MKRTMLLFAAAMLLAGCTTVYTRTGKTGADFETDRKACVLAVKEDLARKGLCET